MKTRSGNIQISRTVTISLDQANVMDLGLIKMVQQRTRNTEICAFSRKSYGILERYIENMRRGMQRAGQDGGGANAQKALALALMFAALNTDDD